MTVRGTNGDANAAAAIEAQLEAQLAALSMLASSSAGVPLRVRPLPTGEPAWTDRVTVYLDLSLPAAALREAAVAQGLLMAAGSLRRSVLRRLIGRPTATRRYFALELRRALRLHGDALPYGVERALRALGSELPSPPDAPESLRLALTDRPPGSPGASFTEMPPHLGRIRPNRLAWSRRDRRGTRRPAEDGRAKPQSDIPRHDADDDELDEKSSDWLRLFSTPLGGGPVSNLFVKLMGFGRAPAPDDAADGDGGGATALDDGAAGAAEAPERAEGLAEGRHMNSTAAPPTAPARHRYPEWDTGAQRYRPDHVHLHEIVPVLDGAAPREHARIARRALRQQIARVGVALQRHRAQPDGDALDLDRVIRYGIERRHGARPDRLHTSARRTRRDLSVLVLLDASGSTADRLTGGETIFGQQRELAREVSRACDQLGDRVAIHAFHSWGRHNVRFMRVKRFEEAHGRAVDARLDALQPAGLTRMGAAIRHGTELLAQDEGHSHRVMLLLSDGFAYDDEYREGHAEGDTKRALQEAAERGIGCVCLNVGSQQDDATLQRLYGGSAYLRCEDARRAVPALGMLMLNAIAAGRAAGSRQRGRRQRTTARTPEPAGMP